MNLFVNSLTTACKIWLQLLKNFFESTYKNFDHNLLSQVTIITKNSTIYMSHLL